MTPMRKSVAAAAVAGSLLVGGAAGVALFGPRLAGAQTSTTTPGSSGSTQSGSAFTSNEDPTHEASESADREAAENSGQFRGAGGHGSNEDATHEAGESAAREAQEDAGHAGSGPSTPAPSASTPSAPNPAL
jgi:hypothetical protein